MRLECRSSSLGLCAERIPLMIPAHRLARQQRAEAQIELLNQFLDQETERRSAAELQRQAALGDLGTGTATIAADTAFASGTAATTTVSSARERHRPRAPGRLTVLIRHDDENDVGHMHRVQRDSLTPSPSSSFSSVVDVVESSESSSPGGSPHDLMSPLRQANSFSIASPSAATSSDHHHHRHHRHHPMTPKPVDHQLPVEVCVSASVSDSTRPPLARFSSSPSPPSLDTSAVQSSSSSSSRKRSASTVSFSSAAYEAAKRHRAVTVSRAFVTASRAGSLDDAATNSPQYQSQPQPRHSEHSLSQRHPSVEQPVAWSHTLYYPHLISSPPSGPTLISSLFHRPPPLPLHPMSPLYSLPLSLMPVAAYPISVPFYHTRPLMAMQ